MRRTLTALGFTSVFAAASLLFTILPSDPSRAAAPEVETFLIPANDGYGVADCLTSGSECGQVVASAWCEAHGYGRAETFGVAAAEDATGSVATEKPKADRPIAITCGN